MRNHLTAAGWPRETTDQQPREPAVSDRAHPAYGDILARDPNDPHRNEIRATPTWTPIAIPGRPGWWRHCIDGQQVDLDSHEPPTA